MSKEKVKKSLPEFLVDGLKYVRSDINEFTMRQLAIGKSIYSKVLNIMQSSDIKDLTNPTVDEGIKIAVAALKLNIENEILALIYFDESDKDEFKLTSYKKRVEAFKELKVKIFKQCEGVVSDFFTYISPFFQEGILTYMKKTTEPQSSEPTTTEPKVNTESNAEVTEP